MVSDPIIPTNIDQDVLKRLAKEHTSKPKGDRYKDPSEVRRLFRTAKVSKSPADWKQALRHRREARHTW